LRVRSDAPVAFVSAKLCDVFPDGTSALVSRGLLNLTHRESSTDPQPLVPGHWYDIEIEIEAAAYRFDPGHRVRLALAGTDWPNIWPPPGAPALDVDCSAVVLTLPVLDGPRIAPAPVLAVPRDDEPGPHDAPGDDDDHEPIVWHTTHDVLAGRTTCTISHGTTYRTPHDGRAAEHYDGDIAVGRANPANADARARARFELTWPDVRVAAEARGSVRSDAANYYVEIELDVDDDGQSFARRRWSEVIPRHLQ
jgi:hypothetical protein